MEFFVGMFIGFVLAVLIFGALASIHSADDVSALEKAEDEHRAYEVRLIADNDALKDELDRVRLENARLREVDADE